MINYHSARGQKAYDKLLAYHKEVSIASIKGEPVLETRGGGQYWYDKYLVGTATKYALIGKDSPELSEQISKIDKIRKQTGVRISEIQECVRILKEDSYQFFDLFEGDLLSKFADAGIFRLGGVLIGTSAFNCYECELGVRMEGKDLIKTSDIDIGSFNNLRFILNETVWPEIGVILQNLSFEEMYASDGNSSGVSKWNNAQVGLTVEFLTPGQRNSSPLSKAPDLTLGTANLVELPPLGVHAQKVSFLEYLLEDPIQAVVLHKNGILVRIPQPVRYAIHKLIVAEIREGKAENNKSNKDRSQALWLIKKIAIDSPDDLLQAIEDVKGRGPKWKRHLEKSINRVPEIQEILEDANAPENNNNIIDK